MGPSRYRCRRGQGDVARSKVEGHFFHVHGCHEVIVEGVGKKVVLVVETLQSDDPLSKMEKSYGAISNIL